MQDNVIKKPTSQKTGDDPAFDPENGQEESSQVLLTGEATVVLDRKSRIMGSNETARRLFGQEMMPGEPFLLEHLHPGTLFNRSPICP